MGYFCQFCGYDLVTSHDFFHHIKNRHCCYGTLDAVPWIPEEESEDIPCMFCDFKALCGEY